MEVTELGIVTDVSPLHSAKAESPMEVTVSGITNLPSLSGGHPYLARHTAVEAYGKIPFGLNWPGSVTDVSPSHPAKARLPMAVTELGIATDVSPLHPSKA